MTRHLKTAHDLEPGQHRKQFGIPGSQSLAAKSYSGSRRQMAIDRGLGEGLAKARGVSLNDTFSTPKTAATQRYGWPYCLPGEVRTDLRRPLDLFSSPERNS